MDYLNNTFVVFTFR